MTTFQNRKARTFSLLLNFKYRVCRKGALAGKKKKKKLMKMKVNSFNMGDLQDKNRFFSLCKF